MSKADAYAWKGATAIPLLQAHLVAPLRGPLASRQPVLPGPRPLHIPRLVSSAPGVGAGRGPGLEANSWSSSGARGICHPRGLGMWTLLPGPGQLPSHKLLDTGACEVSLLHRATNMPPVGQGGQPVALKVPERVGEDIAPIWRLGTVPRKHHC